VREKNSREKKEIRQREKEEREAHATLIHMAA